MKNKIPLAVSLLVVILIVLQAGAYILPRTKNGRANPDPSIAPAVNYIFPVIRIIAVGDIAKPKGKQDLTADLVGQLDPDRILTLGDNAYEHGSLTEYRNYYDPTWGAFKQRTSPSPGNHEYETAGASGYFDYFGSLAGPDRSGYYSFDLGAWHIVSMNSERIDKIQLDWLRDDLKNSTAECVLAYWHQPLFSSGDEHGDNPKMKPFWDLLYDRRADVILNGHEHLYERFAKQDPKGMIDPHGIREFIVGTGGAEQYDFGALKKNSESGAASQFGVLLLTLKSGSYDAEFVPAAGSIFTDRVENVECNK